MAANLMEQLQYLLKGWLKYMDLHFQLSGDCNMVEVTQGEQREDRGERAGFVGVYYRE